MNLEALSEIVRTTDYVVLDTETTGLTPAAEVCQLAIIAPDGSTLLDTLVRPVHGIPPDATRIHHITDEQVAAAPTWPEVKPQVMALTAGKTIIVYNAIYDRRILHQSDAAHGLPETDYKHDARWLCVMEAYSHHYGGDRNYRRSYAWKSLAFAAQHLGLAPSPTDQHTALGDCRTTLAVLQALAAVYA